MLAHNSDNHPSQIMGECFFFQQGWKRGGALAMVRKAEKFARLCPPLAGTDLEVRQWNGHSQTRFVVRFLKSPNRFKT